MCLWSFCRISASWTPENSVELSLFANKNLAGWKYRRVLVSCSAAARTTCCKWRCLVRMCCCLENYFMPISMSLLLLSAPVWNPISFCIFFSAPFKLKELTSYKEKWFWKCLFTRTSTHYPFFNFLVFECGLIYIYIYIYMYIYIFFLRLFYHL